MNSPIANCALQFRFQCPKLWENLQPTGDRGIRFCGICRQHVRLCRDIIQVARHALSGDCIVSFRPHDHEARHADPNCRYDRPREV